MELYEYLLGKNFDTTAEFLLEKRLSEGGIGLSQALFEILNSEDISKAKEIATKALERFKQ